MNLRVVGVLSIISGTLLASIALGMVGRPSTGAVPAPDDSVSPAAGGNVCVAGGGDSDRAVDIVLAGPPGRAGDDVAQADAPRGRAILLTVEEDIGRTAIGPYLAGSVEVVRSELGVRGWSWIGWADHPLVAWREWRSPGGPGEPRASVVARCIAADAPAWVLLGLRTDGGNEARIDLTNPYTVDATFAMSLQTEEGIVEPVALRNVSVPAGTRVSVRVNDHLPEESTVAASVTVGAGRLAVEGLQRATAGVGGVEGASTVPALTVPAPTWTFPWLPAGPDVDGAVWIINPAPRQVVVEAAVHTLQGAGIADAVERIEVPAGGLVRVDTALFAPRNAREFGLTLRSETTAVYVAAGAYFRSEDPDRTGLVRLVPSSVADREWLDAGRYAPGREVALHVVNLSEGAVEPRIELTSVATDAGGAAVPAVRTLTPGAIAPGGVRRVVLPLEGAGVWSATVEGGEALVVSRSTFGVQLLEPVAIDALPSQSWRTATVGLRGREYDGWVARLGTPLDLRRAATPRRPADLLPGPTAPGD